MSDLAVAADRPTAGEGRSTGGRPLRRRSGLPTGRAVVGGFLVALAAVGIFGAYASVTDGPHTSYVVARADIPVGTRLNAGHLTTVAMDLAPSVARLAAFDRVSTLVGTTTIGPIRKGELVQAGDVVKKRSGADELEVSFAIDSSRAVAGNLRAGERVDVLATFGAGAESYTVTVVRQARVIAAERDGGGLGDGRNEIISLALVSSDEALALSHAVNAGEVTLVRSTGASVSGPVGQTYTAPAAGAPG